MADSTYHKIEDDLDEIDREDYSELHREVAAFLAPYAAFADYLNAREGI